jgi:hypothetical protein
MELPGLIEAQNPMGRHIRQRQHQQGHGDKDPDPDPFAKQQLTAERQQQGHPTD